MLDAPRQRSDAVELLRNLGTPVCLLFVDGMGLGRAARVDFSLSVRFGSEPRFGVGRHMQVEYATTVLV